MMRPLILFTLLIVAALGVPRGASAQEAVDAAGATGAIDAYALARIQKHLNGISTLRARFVQSTSQGGFAEGTLLLSRPGKMKIAYAPPTPLEIYADGTWLIYVDHELKEVNQIPIPATPASVLLREKIDFGGDVAVSALEKRDGSYLLHLKEAGEDGSGRLILSFAEAPLALRGWVVIDGQGVETSVVLFRPEINGRIEPREFVFDRPDWATFQGTD